MNILLSLNKAITLWGKQEAVVDGDVRLTYEEFGRCVANLTQALFAKGLGKGSVVAIVAPNCFEFMATYYACAALGVILTPINFRLSVREIGFILQDSGTSVLIGHTDFADLIEQVARDCPQLQDLLWVGSGEQVKVAAKTTDLANVLITGKGKFFDLPELVASDLAHLYYTSGTTGKPKGVMLSHGNVAFHALSAIAEFGLNDTDIWAHVAPMFHLADAWATFAITWVGGKHVFVPYFKVKEVLSVIENERTTISNLIPTMLTAMVNDRDCKNYRFHSLRVLLSGGAPIAPEIVRKVIDTFHCDYIQTYGMTETSPYLTVSRIKVHLNDLSEEEKRKIKSRTGRPFLGVELKVVRSDGKEVDWDDKEVGEIIARGPTVTLGYWKQPEITSETIKDGWLHTGDLAVVDHEGYVNIVDRKKDMIITGGENVYSTEVEYTLHEHQGVQECAVIGVPDARWGQAVVAFVVKRTNFKASAQEIIDFVRDRLAHYKCPKEIVFVKELPKTGSGKICKKVLREKFSSCKRVIE